MQIKPCPICGKQPNVTIDYAYEESGFGGWVTIQCKPLFRKPHLKVEEGKSNNARALKYAIAAWNRRADHIRDTTKKVSNADARQLALKTRVCPMCEDCPDGCPIETPNDSRNKPENKPLTNAQRIRSMADEELAELLSQIAYAMYTPWSELFSRTCCDSCPVTTVKLEGHCHEIDLHECDFTDGKCPYGGDIVYWLRQPAKEE